MEKDNIFVQIASYRDPELIPTLDSLFENAAFPHNIKVCVHNQYSDDDNFGLQKYRKDPNVIIIDTPYNESLGACWARNLIQQKYNNEKYTLQLDSHHRFVKHWDVKLITMYENLREQGHKKPLLTTYATAYDPNNFSIKDSDVPWGMKFDRFTPEGIVFFLPWHMDKDTPEPIPARFYSAHFAFTTGEFCNEVQHDDQIYFHGEEISIAVRAFTHGYSLFHPNEVLVYHEYTRQNRTKHWDDHNSWHIENNKAHERVRKLLGVDGECSPCHRKKLFKEYGLGNVRTLNDYEEYAGIRFSDRALRQSCLDNEIPTLGKKDELYHDKFTHIINLHGNQFQYDDYMFCAIIFEDENKKELFRKDVTNLNDLIKNKDNFILPVESNTKKPSNIVVWAHSASKGWAERLDIPI